MQTSLWIRKFRDAFRGVIWAARTQSSMWVHVSVGMLVMVVAASLRVPRESMAILCLTIGVVIAAEVFNTGFEQLVKTLHPEHDPRIGIALDVAAGAVLVVSIASVLVGVCILGPPLWQSVFPVDPV